MSLKSLPLSLNFQNLLELMGEPTFTLKEMKDWINSHDIGIESLTIRSSRTPVVPVLRKSTPSRHKKALTITSSRKNSKNKKQAYLEISQERIKTKGFRDSHENK